MHDDRARDSTRCASRSRSPRVAGCATTPSRAAGARPAGADAPAQNAAARALVDARSTTRADRAGRRGARQQPRPAARDRAHRARARAGAARAVGPLSERQPRRRTPSRSRIYARSARSRSRPGSARDRQRLSASRSQRVATSSTCGASTARRRAPRRTICWRREYFARDRAHRRRRRSRARVLPPARRRRASSRCCRTR